MSAAGEDAASTEEASFMFSDLAGDQGEALDMMLKEPWSRRRGGLQGGGSS